MFDDNQSIYIQIAKMIEDNILADRLKPDEQAPRPMNLRRFMPSTPQRQEKD